MFKHRTCNGTPYSFFFSISINEMNTPIAYSFQTFASSPSSNQCSISIGWEFARPSHNASCESTFSTYFHEPRIGGDLPLPVFVRLVVED